MAEEDVKDWAGDLQEEMEIDAIEIDETDLEGSGVKVSPISSRPILGILELPGKEKMQKLAGMEIDLNARKLRVALQDMQAERDSLLKKNAALEDRVKKLETRSSIPATNLILENERVRLENNELNEQMLRKCVESDAYLYSMKKIWWILRWLGGYDPDSANTQEPYVWLREYREAVGDIPHDWHK